jgi:NTE family protein
MDRLPIDLVLGGGGVRGIAHVGALATLHQAGYEVNRVAGASAGAIAGALIAAGASPADMKDILSELDWRAFTLSDIVARLADAPLIGGVVDRLRQDRTIDPMEWIDGLLAERGVRTWADLRIDDAPDWMPPAERYRLVVRCLDVVHHRVVRLPWDYHRYGLDPDTQSVAEAVRASMSVPLVFAPVPIGDRDAGGGLLMDGGLGTGFEVDVLDRSDGEPPEHPTFALQLLQRPVVERYPTSDLALIRAVIQTILDTGNQMQPVGPCDEARTVKLDTSHIRTLDVGITEEEERLLFEMGAETMREFLRSWDMSAYSGDCRGGR